MFFKRCHGMNWDLPTKMCQYFAPASTQHTHTQTVSPNFYLNINSHHAKHFSSSTLHTEQDPSHMSYHSCKKRYREKKQQNLH